MVQGVILVKLFSKHSQSFFAFSSCHFILLTLPVSMNKIVHILNNLYVRQFLIDFMYCFLSFCV